MEYYLYALESDWIYFLGPFQAMLQLFRGSMSLCSGCSKYLISVIASASLFTS